MSISMLFARLKRGVIQEWPPPLASVNRGAPRIVLSLVVPIVVIIYKHNLRKVTQKELEWRSEELERRHCKLTAVVQQVKSLLADLEEKIRAKPPESELEPGNFSSGVESLKSDLDGLILKFIGDGGMDVDFRIRFLDVWMTIREVYALKPTHPLIGPGLDLAGQVLSLELSRASTRTLRGSDREYKNAEKLKERLQFFTFYRQTVQRMRKDLDEEHKTLVDQHLRKLRRKSIVGWAIVSKQRKLDIFFALQLIFVARKEILILIAASVASAINGVLDALEVLYRAECYEVLRNPAFPWGIFKERVRAYLSIRAIKLVGNMFANRVRAVGQQNMENRLRTEVYESLLAQDFEWYRLGQTDQRDLRSIFSNVFNLPGNVNAFTAAFTSMVERSVSAIGQTSIILRKSSSLAKAMITLEFGTYLSQKGIAYIKEYLKWDLDRRQVSMDHMGWVEPLDPNYLPTVRACTAEERTRSNWNMFWSLNMRKENLTAIIDVLMEPLAALPDNLTFLGITLRAAQLIKAGNIDMADFEPLKQMSTSVVNHARSLFTTWYVAQENYEPLARSFEILAVEPSIGLKGGFTPEGRAQGALAFEDVVFKYEEGPLVISGMTFDVGAGTTCGITGASGAGKTTIFKLAERFYDPREGRVLLDGIDIRELSPVWVRRQMSLVDQRPVLFNTSLRENLVYGCRDGEEPSLEAIQDACRNAGIYEFVFENKEKFPCGLYTRVSQHTLSGGELQRLAIARAILKNAPILLLDEATSSLDSNNQSAVKAALTNLMKGKTVVMIAHRLETIKEADQIIVVNNGTVSERGSHSDLVNQCGEYAKLYEQQVTATMVPASVQ